jgi:hypothetical protein
VHAPAQELADDARLAAVGEAESLAYQASRTVRADEIGAANRPRLAVRDPLDVRRDVRSEILERIQANAVVDRD